ncbi:RNA polymerase II C-terminal domain phosphatase-like [Actinidia chinensis var. chinensis]|uniref:RNA polymerase II C-terminal domain phosphatase-like n=1 Tax=Actinidia chinensis var. chinensis TaxID=1590841 RepID=A0A2R6QS29_ACTCC|nr:RNA polymerase II C-terminal domain phosphatase-like [Actinidia chinensis var. chinensis]
MSLATDSPVHSSSSDDFAAFLDTELASNPDTSSDQVDEDGDEDDIERIKRQKVEVSESVKDSEGSTSHLAVEHSLEASVERDLCAHPGFIRGLCMICGQKVDDTAVLKYDTAVALKYIHKDLRLGNDEMVRLRNRDLKNLLRHKKLYLVLDLDHTLLNSTRLLDITPDEEYLNSQTDSLQDISRGSLFRLDFMHMLTKLRPFVRTFLKEASNLFEMYIYTMGERAYALEMANLLDPGKVYFNSRVIAQDDCTQRHQKGLDVVLGQESAVLILDDTEPVWAMHKENLILMERYNFFGSSCRQFGFRCKSLAELKSDESETDGALASILKVLKQIHSIFFDSEPGVNLADRDVRQVIKTVRKEVLKGCTIVFSRVFPTKFQAENHYLWKMAENLGATCLTEVDPSVTHVVSTDTGTEKSRWAVKGKKFVVHPRWIEAANYFWQKQPEEDFPINQTEKTENQ